MMMMKSSNFYQLLCFMVLWVISNSFFVGKSRFYNYVTHLKVAKFDPAQFIEVKAKKPLGVTLYEIEENAKSGVFIGEIDKEGSLSKIKGVTLGLYLLKINDKDVKYEDFDTVLNSLIEAPADEEISLTFIDPKKVTNGPAVVKVKAIDGSEKTISTIKGQNLRTLLLGSNVEVYDLKGKFSNCGGGGICGTCAVEIDGAEDWGEAPEFEKKKLRRFNSNARLSCNTIVEGDCTVTIQPKPTAANK